MLLAESKYKLSVPEKERVAWLISLKRDITTEVQPLHLQESHFLMKAWIDKDYDISTEKAIFQPKKVKDSNSAGKSYSSNTQSKGVYDKDVEEKLKKFEELKK